MARSGTLHAFSDPLPALAGETIAPARGPAHSSTEAKLAQHVAPARLASWECNIRDLNGCCETIYGDLHSGQVREYHGARPTSRQDLATSANAAGVS